MALAAASRSGESTGYLSRSAKRSAIFLLYAAHFCSAASMIWSNSFSSGKLAPPIHLLHGWTHFGDCYSMTAPNQQQTAAPSVSGSAHLAPADAWPDIPCWRWWPSACCYCESGNWEKNGGDEVTLRRRNRGP